MTIRLSWKAAGGVQLEQNAHLAATADVQHVLIEAGPGAGKTEVLAQRADYLFRTGGCPYPHRILAVSFKVDAARNLRERVRRRSGEQYASRFDSLTFHAFAKRLIDNYRPALTGPYALVPEFRIHEKTAIPGEQITFSDLVPYALEILRVNPFALGALRHSYTHVLLDEFQDATQDQYELLTTAFLDSGSWVTAVGDTKQRIMGWAGALDGVMGKFATEFSAVRFRLYENYRAAPRLRRMQARIIAELEPNAAQPPFSADPVDGAEGTISVLAFVDASAEAETLAQIVEAWLAEGTLPRDIAILLRQQPTLYAAELMEQLHSRGVLVADESKTQDLYAEPVAALIFNFVQVVAGARQPRAYLDLMNVVSRLGGSQEATDKAAARTHRYLREARAAVAVTHSGSATETLWPELIESFLKFFTEPSLRALSPSYRVGARLDEVVLQSTQFVQMAFEEEPDRQRACRRLAGEDAVRVLTIHKSKGLEFEKVVILGVETEPFRGDDLLFEFFVAVSRAKSVLVLTHAQYRERPHGAPLSWRTARSAQAELLGYAAQE